MINVACDVCHRALEDQEQFFVLLLAANKNRINGRFVEDVQEHVEELALRLEVCLDCAMHLTVENMSRAIIGAAGDNPCSSGAQ